MDKRIKISATISLIFNLLLVILVCVAGLRIEAQNEKIDGNALIISRMESEKEILQHDVDRYQAVYDSNQRELLDMENTFVDYTVDLTSRLAGKELTEEDITEEYLEALIADLISRPRTIEVVSEVEKLVYITGNVTTELKDFESSQELGDFLTVDTIEEIPAYWSIGDNVTIRFWCYDYAEMLRDALYDAGYRGNIQCFSAGLLPGTDEVIDTAHVMISVRVGDEVWLVEPQTDEYWHAWDIHLMEVE